MLALAVAIIFSAGCSTIAQGYDNLMGRSSVDSTTSTTYGGASVTVKTIPPTPFQKEQAIATNLQSQVQSLRFSIMARDMGRAEMRSRGLLRAIEKAEGELRGNDSLRATQIRTAIAILRQAIPKRDVQGMQAAIKWLHQVRGA